MRRGSAARFWSANGRAILRRFAPTSRAWRARRTEVRRTSHRHKRCARRPAFGRGFRHPPACFPCVLGLRRSRFARLFRPSFSSQMYPPVRVRADQRLARDRALGALQTSTLFTVSRSMCKGWSWDSVWPRFSAPFFNDLQPNEVVRVLRLSTEQVRKSWKNRAGSSKAKTPELGWRNRGNGAPASTAIGG